MPPATEWLRVHWDAAPAALGHVGATPLDQVLAHWTPSQGLLAAACVSVLLYLRGWWALQRRCPRRLPRWRLWAFLAGTASLLVALVSPLDALADALLSAHMAQHLLLMMVAPPLLWLGAPLAPWLRALPDALRRRGVARLVAWRPLRALARGVARPAFCLVTFFVVTWLWHLPALYEWALRDERVHDAEHLCFLAAGLLFWWPVVSPWPARGAGRHWVALPYLLLAMLENTLFSALFTFSDRLLYPSYAAGPHPFGLAPLADQALAGAVMWVPGSLAMLLPAVAILVRLLDAPPAGAARRTERPSARIRDDLSRADGGRRP
jgi:cytochrome c oxidase assembly factor CtaG